MNVIVGRSAELDLMAKVVADARKGPAAAIVVGEAGSGKSTLLAEARRRNVTPHRFDVVGYEPERHVPLAAAASLLRVLAEDSIHGEALRALLVRPGRDSTADPVRLFEAAYRSFRAVEPVLLVIDDLQWMDERSFALCHYLVRAGCESGQRVAVFAAARPGERGGELGELLPPERVTRILLRPLTRDEGVALVASIAPQIDIGRAEELWERARGSPFWLDALARAGGAPGGLADALTARMRGASSDAGLLLGLLAVAGRPLLVSDAAAALDWSLSRGEAVLTELVSRGVAVAKAGTAQPVHELLGRAALTELSADSKRDLHRRLARQIEASGPELHALLEALEHRRAAGLVTPDVARRLARLPRRALVGKRGLELLGEVADELDPLDPETLDFIEEIAALAVELAEHELALARWTQVGELAADPLRRSSALLAASKSAYALGRGLESRALLARSRDAAPPRDEVLELEQDTHEGAILLWANWRTAEGRAIARDVVDRAARMVAESGGVESLSPRARRAYLDALRLDFESAFQEGDATAVVQAARARERLTRGLDLEAVLRAALDVGIALLYSGRHREAASRVRSLWDEADRHVLPGLGVDSGFWLATALAQTGELIEAEQVAGEVVALAARVGDAPRARHRVARVACDVWLERGHPSTVLQRLEHEASVEQSDHQRIPYLWDIALWCARLDGADAAERVREALDAARACAASVGCPRCAGELEVVAAEALARIGDRAEARSALWRGFAPRRLPPRQRLLWRHAAALSRDSASTRIARLRHLAAARTELQLVRLWIRLDLGRALAGEGSDEAVPVLEELAAQCARCGAGTVQELAEQALRSLGVRTWRRGRTGAPLTEREEEVARLVSGGLTNREIAREIFLSPKTVERHVSNAMKKLGARNRAELAARVHAAGEMGETPDDKERAPN